MTIFYWMKQAIEYLAGEQDEPPANFALELSNWWFWAPWWGAMLVLIYIFCGQSSKFIYIDF
jgi:hypothetical protein